MVAYNMVLQGLCRNREYNILQFLQIMNAGYFLHRTRIDENKIAETEIPRNSIPQIDIHFLGILIDERSFKPGSIGTVALLCRLKNQRHVRITLADLSQQFNAGQRINGPFTGETGIGNNSQNIVLESFIEVHCFFIRTGKYNLGTAAHSQRPLMFVQSFRGKLLTLGEDKLIKIRQDRRIETDGIFHQQDHLNANFIDIMLQIHLILDQLDDGQEQIRISQPAKYIFKYTQIFMFHTRPDTMGKRSQNDQRNMRIFLLDLTSDIKRIAVVGSGHTDYQIKHCISQLSPGIFFRRNLRETRRITQAEVHIFNKDLFVYPTVILQHKCIVRIGNQQDIKDTFRHQIGELGIFEAVQF